VVAVEVAPSSSKVNNPPHYQGRGGIEVIDVIEDFSLGFNLGNVIKYALRAGRKGEPVECLEKAAWYLAREIQRVKARA